MEMIGALMIIICDANSFHMANSCIFLYQIFEWIGHLNFSLPFATATSLKIANGVNHAEQK